MTRAVRVWYEKGVLRPFDTVELWEGEELEVVIVRRSFRGFWERASRYRFNVDRGVVEDFVVERK